MSALEKLLEKGVDETTSLEHAVQILFLNEATGGKPLANEAAQELARLRAVEAIVPKLIELYDSDPEIVDAAGELDGYRNLIADNYLALIALTESAK